MGFELVKFERLGKLGIMMERFFGIVGDGGFGIEGGNARILGRFESGSEPGVMVVGADWPGFD